MTPPPTTPTPKRERLNMGELKHADDCQSHIVDVRGRPDECTCGADTRPRTEGRGEGEPVKCLGERFRDAFLRGWGDDRLVAYADLPAESQAKWNRAALAFVCTLSDAPSELKSALAEALGVLRPFARVYDELCGRGLSYAISGDDGVIYADDDNFADASDLVQRFSTGRVDGVEL